MQTYVYTQEQEVQFRTWQTTSKEATKVKKKNGIKSGLTCGRMMGRESMAKGEKKGWIQFSSFQIYL